MIYKYIKLIKYKYGSLSTSGPPTGLLNLIKCSPVPSNSRSVASSVATRKTQRIVFDLYCAFLVDFKREKVHLICFILYTSSFVKLI